jgi:hypothetical protein
MPSLRLGFLVVVCFGLGLAAGLYLKHEPARSLAVTASRSPAIQPASSPKPKEITFRINDTPAIASYAAPPSVADRMTIMSWMKHNGLDFGIPVFSNDLITPQFALFYGLTPTETAELNQAYQQAKRRLASIADQHASLDPASTDSKLIVNVLPFPTEGGEAYKALLSTFVSVLGADRYAMFNDISGDMLETSFSGFGLGGSRFEVTRRVPDHGSTFYDIKRSNSLPAIGGNPYPSAISTIGAMTAEDLKAFPILKAYPLPTVSSPSK